MVSMPGEVAFKFSAVASPSGKCLVASSIHREIADRITPVNLGEQPPMKRCARCFLRIALGHGDAGQKVYRISRTAPVGLRIRRPLVPAVERSQITLAMRFASMPLRIIEMSRLREHIASSAVEKSRVVVVLIPMQVIPVMI